MKFQPQELVDLGLEIGLVPDAKYHYRWNELSDWQFDTMMSIGMKKHHFILDIGCGALRFGVRAIDFLDENHYFGIDAINEFVEMGKMVVDRAGIFKKYTTVVSREFKFFEMSQRFDFAIAQSVFTHLTIFQVKSCIMELKKVMVSGGRLLFTYTEKSRPYGFLYNGFEPVIAGEGINDDILDRISLDYNVKIISHGIKHPYQKVGIIEF